MGRPDMAVLFLVHWSSWSDPALLADDQHGLCMADLAWEREPGRGSCYVRLRTNDHRYIVMSGVAGQLLYSYWAAHGGLYSPPNRHLHLPKPLEYFTFFSTVDSPFVRAGTHPDDIPCLQDPSILPSCATWNMCVQIDRLSSCHFVDRSVVWEMDGSGAVPVGRLSGKTPLGYKPPAETHNPWAWSAMRDYLRNAGVQPSVIKEIAKKNKTRKR